MLQIVWYETLSPWLQKTTNSLPLCLQLEIDSAVTMVTIVKLQWYHHGDSGKLSEVSLWLQWEMYSGVTVVTVGNIQWCCHGYSRELECCHHGYSDLQWCHFGYHRKLKMLSPTMVTVRNLQCYHCGYSRKMTVVSPWLQWESLNDVAMVTVGKSQWCHHGYREKLSGMLTLQWETPWLQ